METNNELYKKDVYTIPNLCVIDRPMYEYDIQQANISILLQANIITSQEYRYLESVPKIVREILIGKKIENNIKIADELSNGFKNARKMLIETNSIPNTSIIEIRKDSVLVVDTKLENTKFDHINFKLKNVYTSYYNLNKVNLVLLLQKRASSIMNREKVLVIKGISPAKQLLHKEYLMKYLFQLLSMVETNKLSDAIVNLSIFINKYKSKELAIPYYREFNSESKYRIRLHNEEYGIDYVDKYSNYIPPISIEYNYEVLASLYRILIQQYLK